MRKLLTATVTALMLAATPSAALAYGGYYHHYHHYHCYYYHYHHYCHYY